MSNDIKCCNIIYGYVEDFILSYHDYPIILIEPRKNIIDKINKLKLDNIIVIKKVLVNKKSLSETVLYNDKINDNYWLRQDDLSINGTNFFNINKELVYTISLVDLINKYKIQNIKNLVLNININNNKEVLKSIEQFNHIISYIKVKADFKCDFFNNFYKESEENANYIVYIHKNLKIKLPKIAIYFNNLNSILDIDKLTLLLNQYQMSLIITESDITTNIIEYPDSINKLNVMYKKTTTNNNKKQSHFFHDKIINDLDKIFNDNKINKENVINSNELIQSNIDNIDNINNLDIIIQFNHKYFEVHNTLQIMYPLKNNIIYINKMYDIIYATKNCMYMLYQIIKSKYFSSYLDDKKTVNPKLFKIMSKRYFYEYIEKIFNLKYF